MSRLLDIGENFAKAAKRGKTSVMKPPFFWAPRVITKFVQFPCTRPWCSLFSGPPGLFQNLSSSLALDPGVHSASNINEYQKQ
jgi:hypothetical protein